PFPCGGLRLSKGIEGSDDVVGRIRIPGRAAAVGKLQGVEIRTNQWECEVTGVFTLEVPIDDVEEGAGRARPVVFVQHVSVERDLGEYKMKGGIGLHGPSGRIVLPPACRDTAAVEVMLAREVGRGEGGRRAHAAVCPRRATGNGQKQRTSRNTTEQLAPARVVARCFLFYCGFGGRLRAWIVVHFFTVD